MIGPACIEAYAQAHNLPDSFCKTATQWFLPIAEQLAQHQQTSKRTLLVGITGSQGSGKTTLANLLCELLIAEGLTAISLSIDDFYLTRTERQLLAETHHPLLRTRGVPGTHDLNLMKNTLDQLHKTGACQVPVFDKSIDDRLPTEAWQKVSTPVDIILFEGWCIGALPQTDEALALPVNSLEKEEDASGKWRRFVNQALINYQPIFSDIDIWIMLKAPSFNCVSEWRMEQEDKLKQNLRHSKPEKDANQIMTPKQVQRFIEHFQRVTEHILKALPETVHYLIELSDTRQITTIKQPKEVVL